MGLFAKRKSPAPAVDFDRLPQHIAIIMDGNGRWAKKRGLPRTAGHAAGSESFRDLVYYCRDIGLKYLTVYAFSTENWKRPAEEVSAIMKLLEKYLDEAIESMVKDNIRLNVFGDISVLSPELQTRIARTNELNREIGGMQANLCVNYGGRDEILRGVRRAVEDVKAGRLAPEQLDEEAFSAYLYTAGMPDPELIIRPSGELRLSNFLLWQCAYSEFYFSDVLWPDFDRNELNKAIADYQSRDRRFGGI